LNKFSKAYCYAFTATQTYFNRVTANSIIRFVKAVQN